MSQCWLLLTGHQEGIYFRGSTRQSIHLRHDEKWSAVLADKEVELVSSSSAAETAAPAQPSEGQPAAVAPAQVAPAAPAASNDDEPPPPEPFGEDFLLIFCDTQLGLRYQPAALPYSPSFHRHFLCLRASRVLHLQLYLYFNCSGSSSVCCRVHSWRSLVRGR